jgi:hypothetical protein
MKNLVPFSKGSQSTPEEMHMLEKIRVLANLYATGDAVELLTVLTAYTKINGPARKISKLLDLTPTDYARILTAATLRLRGDDQFRNLFHYIRFAADEVKIDVPRFPAAPPAF